MSAQSKMSAELFSTASALAVTFDVDLDLDVVVTARGMPGMAIFDQFGFWTASNDLFGRCSSTL